MLLRFWPLLLGAVSNSFALQAADLREAVKNVDDPACEYKEWTGFSECSCGSLSKYRTRELKDPPSGPLAKWAPNGHCNRIDSEEVACPADDCECIDVRRSGDCNSKELNFCANKNTGVAELGSKDWAWWLRRFCAKTCDLCVKKVPSNGSTSTTEPPETESTTSEAASGTECKCGDWRTIQTCSVQMCGGCGRKIEVRDCNSDNCWRRKETACREGRQKRRCRASQFALGGTKFESWPESFAATTKGCCTPTRFGPNCDPLGDPGK